MRVICRHGHFAFYPKNEKEISRFSSIFSQPLFREEDFYTFALLKGAPNYSLLGKPYLGIPAIKTFAGSPWEVMEANGFVYDFSEMVLKPKALILRAVSLLLVEDFWAIETPLLQPGSLDVSGKRIVSYDAELNVMTSQLRIFEVEYA